MTDKCPASHQLSDCYVDQNGMYKCPVCDEPWESQGSRTALADQLVTANERISDLRTQLEDMTACHDEDCAALEESLIRMSKAEVENERLRRALKEIASHPSIIYYGSELVDAECVSIARAALTPSEGEK